ncbi:hypothetical protein [Nocardioides sp. KR10-350]|uniref:hypothetical protein n=1 Tax=Nocardioides cheoyonin TaxID=3156615 RepID=UPI0032B477B3
MASQLPSDDRALGRGVRPLLTRRLALQAGAVTMAGLVLNRPVPARAAAAGSYPSVAELPPGAPKRETFEKQEQGLAAYLMILAPMANDIVTDGSDLHGWMSGGWWRSPSASYNARVMEHVATLAWFYANERPWNPYHLDQALGDRLDAAIGYYLGLQHDDGTFPETSLSQHGKAATAFGLTALSTTLRALSGAGAYPERREQIRSALGAAADWVLDETNAAMWTYGSSGAANQSAAALVGAYEAAVAIGDDVRRQSAVDRIGLLAQTCQSAGGWFHESDGFDQGYNFGVELPDLGHLYALTGDERVAAMARSFADFLQYVALDEPDSPGPILAAAFSSRTNPVGSVRDFEPPDDDSRAEVNELLAAAPLLGAFRPASQDVQASQVAWGKSSEAVAPRAKQDTSPRLWMYELLAPKGLDVNEKARRAAQLAPVANSRFTEPRVGEFHDMQFLFVRRPAYYLAALYGEPSSVSVRVGPQLLWHPDAGTVVLGFNGNTTDSFWGTLTPGSGTSDAREHLAVSYAAGGAAVGVDQLRGATGDLTITTRGASTGVVTTTTIADDGFVRDVDAGFRAYEQVPLLLREADQIALAGSDASASWGSSTSTTATGVSITRSGITVTWDWGEPLATTITAKPARLAFADDDRMQHLLRVTHPGTIRVRTTIA